MLGKTVKKLCALAGFSGRRTNHSCRASSATRMYDSGADEQLICERTGHRSIAVRSYKRTSSNQLKDVSNMLYGNISRDKKPSCTVSKAEDVKDEVNVGVKKPKVEEIVEQVSSNEATGPIKLNVQEKTDQTCDSEAPRGLVLNINVNFSK